MTDLQILGLKKSFSYAELKKAFREKSKHYHPDTNQDKMNSHLAMISLNQAYANLLGQLKSQQAGLNNPGRGDGYSIYKEGICHFQSIHPSKWKTLSADGLFNASAIKTAPETPEIINLLLNRMAQAYHMFSIIVVEYENSPWYSDALRKMREIEKMTVRYKKIRDSYEAEMNA